MTTSLVPLTMATVDRLPLRCRSCVTWEVPGAAAAVMSAGDAAFEKEVWLSGVMLTWGSAGQIVLVDDEPAGFVLYAPPTAIPAAAAFPTAPVSPDAVLLTTLRIRDDRLGQGLGRFLMNGALVALARRGVRAIELFGREDTGRGEAEAESTPEDPAGPGELADRGPAAAIPRCLVPAGFARAVGFRDVRAHPRFPRLRFEITGESGWKAEVEYALERLFTVITVPAAPLTDPARVPAGVH